MKQRWCEHWRFEEYCWIRTSGDREGNPIHDEARFCPICGTPRPVEKSLAEKFKEFGDKRFWEVGSAYEEMAKIAETHFKEGVS